MRNTNDKNTVVDTKYNLTKRQLDFALNYVETGNATQSAIKAGYSPKTAYVQAYRLLENKGIRDKIYDLRHDENKLRIATGKEVMDFFTRVMYGEVKDQFGLDSSLSDRLKAANELAKRTVDIDNKVSGVSDNKIQIKLEWGSDSDEEETDKVQHN